MKIMKKFYAMALGISMLVSAAMSLESCQQDDYEPTLEEQTNTSCTIEGRLKKNLLKGSNDQVAEIDSYGMLVPSFTPKDMLDAGFEYSDLLDVKIGDSICLHNVPFVTGFNEVGVFEVCFCDYNAQGKMYGFGQLHGNFSERIGGKPGDRIIISLAKRHGYKETWEVMKSIYSENRNDYESDEVFANFRPVNTTGMAKGVLYRSSNPLNPVSNPVRYQYVDHLAQSVGINTEIDLADTMEKIDTYRNSEGFAATYCPELVDSGNTIVLGLTADVYSDTFMKKLGEGLRFMINHKAPYLVHCNEGKDRCGFVIILLESLAGATYQEVADDYLQTLINFYKIEKNDNSYMLRKSLSVDRLCWLLENYSSVDDCTHIDWASKNPASVNLQKAAHDYVIDCGLSEAECAKLQSILQGATN